MGAETKSEILSGKNLDNTKDGENNKEFISLEKQKDIESAWIPHLTVNYGDVFEDGHKWPEIIPGAIEIAEPIPFNDKILKDADNLLTSIYTNAHSWLQDFQSILKYNGFVLRRAEERAIEHREQASKELIFLETVQKESFEKHNKECIKNRIERVKTSWLEATEAYHDIKSGLKAEELILSVLPQVIKAAHKGYKISVADLYDWETLVQSRQFASEVTEDSQTIDKLVTELNEKKKNTEIPAVDPYLHIMLQDERLRGKIHYANECQTFSEQNMALNDSIAAESFITSEFTDWIKDFLLKLVSTLNTMHGVATFKNSLNSLLISITSDTINLEFLVRLIQSFLEAERTVSKKSADWVSQMFLQLVNYFQEHNLWFIRKDSPVEWKSVLRAAKTNFPKCPDLEEDVIHTLDTKIQPAQPEERVMTLDPDIQKDLDELEELYSAKEGNHGFPQAANHEAPLIVVDSITSPDFEIYDWCTDVYNTTRDAPAFVGTGEPHVFPAKQACLENESSLVKQMAESLSWSPLSIDLSDPAFGLVATRYLRHFLNMSGGIYDDIPYILATLAQSNYIHFLNEKIRAKDKIKDFIYILTRFTSKLKPVLVRALALAEMELMVSVAESQKSYDKLVGVEVKVLIASVCDELVKNGLTLFDCAIASTEIETLDYLVDNYSLLLKRVENNPTHVYSWPNLLNTEKTINLGYFAKVVRLVMIDREKHQ